MFLGLNGVAYDVTNADVATSLIQVTCGHKIGLDLGSSLSQWGSTLADGPAQPSLAVSIRPSQSGPDLFGWAGFDLLQPDSRGSFVISIRVLPMPAKCSAHARNDIIRMCATRCMRLLKKKEL